MLRRSHGTVNQHRESKYTVGSIAKSWARLFESIDCHAPAPVLSNIEQQWYEPVCIYEGMGTNSTLLCIHRDPAQLSLLAQNGYELVTATTGSDGLRLFMLQAVDAIVLDYQLGLLDGGIVAAEIKKVKPEIPIVMLAENLELPYNALQSVDALVAKADGPHFLLETVRHVLNVKPGQRREGDLESQTPIRRAGKSRDGVERRQANIVALATNNSDAPFSPRVWRGIWNGNIQFAPTTKVPHEWSTRAVPTKIQS
jgi:CheY-like chemotaxis protein